MVSAICGKVKNYFNHLVSQRDSNKVRAIAVGVLALAAYCDPLLTGGIVSGALLWRRMQAQEEAPVRVQFGPMPVPAPAPAPVDDPITGEPIPPEYLARIGGQDANILSYMNALLASDRMNDPFRGQLQEEDRKTILAFFGVTQRELDNIWDRASRISEEQFRGVGPAEYEAYQAQDQKKRDLRYRLRLHAFRELLQARRPHVVEPFYSQAAVEAQNIAELDDLI